MRVYTYMILAKKESLKSEFKHQLGACIVKGGRVLSVGHNSIRHLSTGKKYSKWESSLHAERDACRKVEKENLKNAVIFIYRETADGNPALAYPCEHCYKMIKELGLKRIYFSQPEYPYYGEIRL